jgi:hypothetical protein
MGKVGREPSCAEVRPINMVEEIASANTNPREG